MEFDVEYDVVVIGSGASGKAAAYTVASESSLSVCMLEKSEDTGGTTKYTEGMCASGSFLQVGTPVADYPEPMPEDRHWPTIEEHVKCYMDYSHNRANPDVVRAYVYNSAETIQIFTDLGIEFKPVASLHDHPGELFVFHRPKGEGAHVHEVLLRACINAGVDIFTSTPAKELLFEKGEIVGVKAVDADDVEMLIGAKAVIIATGGWADDHELMDKYSWIDNISEKILPQRAGINNDGDGLRMALSAGADTKGIGCLMISSRLKNKTAENPLFIAAWQPTLWVNKRGERFYNENIARSFSDCGVLNAQQEDGIMYILHDAKTLQHLEEFGSDIGLGGLIPFRTKATGVAEAAQECMEEDDGIAWISDTVEGLAQAIGLSEEALVAAVARYNELCAEGYDYDYLKPAEYMTALDTPPFVAIRKAPIVNVSCGGIRVNGNFQVTDEHYEPIAHLYAVGNEASGLYGDTYNLNCPGSANGFAHTSGRLAARHAIKMIERA